MEDQDLHEDMTAAEFAARARVTIRAVQRWEAKGVGPKPIRPSGARIVRYRRDEVEDWLNGKPATTGVAQ